MVYISLGYDTDTPVCRKQFHRQAIPLTVQPLRLEYRFDKLRQNESGRTATGGLPARTDKS